MRLPIPPPGHLRKYLRHSIKNLNPTVSANLEDQGVVLGHRDGHGFVQRANGLPDIFLPPTEMRAVLHRDQVRVQIVRTDRRGRPEGKVLEIVGRPTQTIIGRLLYENSVWRVAPEDKRYGSDIIIPHKAINGAQIGQVVAVLLTAPPSLYGQPVGRVSEVLGAIDDPGIEIEIAVRKFGVPHQFSEACLNQTRALPDQVQSNECKGRVDLRGVALVTIDGEDARDFDDAVYAEPTQVGPRKGWRLLVAIADVSHYVHSGSAIDVDAFERATSIYFPRRVIPMLPEKLSNGLCSLNPDVDRLCVVCDMLITADGDIETFQFYTALMHSHARFTYTQVAEMLSNTDTGQVSHRPERLNDLIHLHGVYLALLGARQRRGAIDFDSIEHQIIFDQQGQIEKIVPRARNDAHRMIEEAMLAANSCSAEFILQSKHPGLYRVHEAPASQKLKLLREYLQALAVHLPLGDEPRPHEFQAIAEAVKGRPDAHQIHMMLLRSMPQAIYSPSNIGHFGLAYEAYTHFTSPIRRYPDLLVHQVIKSILAGKTFNLPHLPAPGEAQVKLERRLAQRERETVSTPKAGKRENTKAPADWVAAGLHCSANERRADEASNDVLDWLKCKYMLAHLGAEFSGAVSTVTSFGLFVTLDDLYVDGLVHITELGGDYFHFDEVRHELRGERTGMVYTIGSRLRVQVSRVNLDARKIDFRPIPIGSESQVKPKRGEHAKGHKESPTGRPHGGEAVKVKTKSRHANRKSGSSEAVTPKPASKKLAGKKKTKIPKL